MNLGKKKELASRTLKIGKARVLFVKARLEDIKEAITKRDILDLKSDGAIKIKEISGRKKNEKRKNARGPGKIKKKVNRRKKDYVIMVRGQRRIASEMLKQKNISKEQLTEIRKKIRNKAFKSKAHLKNHIKELNN